MTLYKFNNVHRNVLCGLCGSFCLFSVLFGALRLLVFFLNLLFLKKFPQSWFFLKSGLSASVFWTKAFASAFSALNCRRAAFLYGCVFAVLYNHTALYGFQTVKCFRLSVLSYARLQFLYFRVLFRSLLNVPCLIRSYLPYPPHFLQGNGGIYRIEA